MKPKQAFRIVNGYFWKGLQDLNWDAHLYDRGIVKNSRTKKASEQWKRAHEALTELHRLVEEEGKTS
jgi:hypothetical protein